MIVKTHWDNVCTWEPDIVIEVWRPCNYLARVLSRTLCVHINHLHSASEEIDPDAGGCITMSPKTLDLAPYGTAAVIYSKYTAILRPCAVAQSQWQSRKSCVTCRG